MNDLLEHLSCQGYKYQFESGVLMILVDVADEIKFQEIRNIVHGYGYEKSFGIKQKNIDCSNGSMV